MLPLASDGSPINWLGISAVPNVAKPCLSPRDVASTVRRASISGMPLSNPLDEEEDSRSKVPIWLPVAAFIGTSFAVAIPVFMVRRQRQSLSAISRVGLQGSNAPPPPPRRRLVPPPPGSSPSSDLRARLVARASTPTNVSFKSESNSEERSPGLGSLMSAMSQLTLSNAMFAGKAFAIATFLVTLGGGVLVLGVKTALGVNEAHEFGAKMRSFLWSVWPSLSNSIHRSPESEEERRESSRVAPYGTDEEWSVEASEARLKRAYQEGGVTLWAQIALRELEAEARFERSRRAREVAELKDRR
ncbi:hypothetical protein NMY22_g9077 [Coprinellus aureogranulatus]|nr:hypothetical protein NMY22_g9077 [Coprinellus aureogranulatus]